MSRCIDLTGERFGRLVVLKRVANNKHEQSMWACTCDCGKEKIMCGHDLKNSHTKSCGCLKKEHGHSARGEVSKTYTVWCSMIQRCINTNATGYHSYGGRGIIVCGSWLNSFENFLEDMGEVPEGYQIDRINNNGNYCKSNCRWATPKENSRNTRINRLITFNGKTQCLVEWAEELNIGISLLWYRLKHWSIEKALTTPVGKYKKGEN